MVAAADPWTRLARSLATVLLEFAEGTPQVEADVDELSVSDELPRPADEHALGKRQRQIVEVPGLATEEGLKTADVAASIDYEVPNTYTALQALARYQVVEQVPAKEPQHWRLVRRYRVGSRLFTRLLTLVASGEWTTAGDVSIAARGDLRASEAIMRAGISHRVLADATTREQTSQLLQEEGVRFLADGRPDSAQRVGWDELARRLAKEDERRRTMTRAALNYIQIPAIDLEDSITFFEDVLGWKVKRHPTVGAVLDQTAYPEFTDSTGNAGGAFVLGRPPSREPGVMACIAVDNIDDVLEAVVSHGGEIVKRCTAIVEGADWEAVFRDPAGNAFGLYEHR
jgi:predicted enzyme related to lactoylglutathione lyase